MYFVYLPFNGKAFPQKWLELFNNSATGKAYATLKNVKLAEAEYGMSLDELAKKYPLELKE